jgi:hypothetical protein
MTLWIDRCLELETHQTHHAMMQFAQRQQAIMICFRFGHWHCFVFASLLFSWYPNGGMMTDNACPKFTSCVHAAANFQVLTSGCHDLLELLWVLIGTGPSSILGCGLA